MPIPQVFRIDPRDLEVNKGIGIPIPFNAKGVFNTTYSTKDQIKSNLINLLLTYKGERIMNPEFGADLPRLLFEQLDETLYQQIQNQIINNVITYIPEITLNQIEITPNNTEHSVTINVIYTIKLSGINDNVIIDFSTLQ